ncbi:hypothetical protein [Nostoc sp.]|uniref:hypothetical protein n=1 Tax=Nostoc sp. TaxID=1180 RepID=UPI002FEFFF5D
MNISLHLYNSYHVRQITCDMSLRVQRSGRKQSQGFWDCFTSYPSPSETLRERERQGRTQ